MAAIWIAGPPIAAGIVTIGLGVTGFDADETTVTVVADPPFDLVGGRADEIRIRATNATFGGLTAVTVDVVLVDVDILDRRAEFVRGRLEGVVVGATDERLAVSAITFEGAGDEADAAARVRAESIETLAAQSIESSVGTAPDSVDLVAPDVLAFSVAGVSAQARLAVDELGNLAALGVPGANGAVLLVGAASIARFQVDAVAVEGGELVVRGKLDVAALLR
jgi:hypothetical protein